MTARSFRYFLFLPIFFLSTTICSAQSAPDVIFSVDRVGIGAQAPATSWSDQGGDGDQDGFWEKSYSGSASDNSITLSSSVELSGQAGYFQQSANYKVTVYVRGDATSTITSTGGANASASSDGYHRASASGGTIPFSSAIAEATKPAGPPGSDNDAATGGGTHFTNIGCGGAGSAGSRTFAQYPGVTYRVPPGASNIPFGSSVRNDGTGDVDSSGDVNVGLTVELGDDEPVALIDGPYTNGNPPLVDHAEVGDTVYLNNYSYDPDNQDGATAGAGICNALWEITDPDKNVTYDNHLSLLSFVPDRRGPWKIKLVVTDNEGDTAEASDIVYVGPPPPRPGGDGPLAAFGCEKGKSSFDGGIHRGSGNSIFSWYDPVSTRGFPLEFNLHINTQTRFPTRVTEFGNASYTYGIEITTHPIEGISHWFIIDADGQELEYGPAASAPVGGAGNFSTLSQVTGGFELLNAGPPESVEKYGNYSYTFNSNGKLTSLTDPSGNLQTVVRDGSDNIVEVVDQSTNRKLEFEYDTPGVVARIVEGDGEAVTHLQQSSGRIDVITLKDSLGNNIRRVVYTYNQLGLVASFHLDDPAAVYTIDYLEMSEDVYVANFNRPGGGGSNINFFVEPPSHAAYSSEVETAEGGFIRYDFGTNGELLNTAFPKLNGASQSHSYNYGYNDDLLITSWDDQSTYKTWTYDSLGRLTNATTTGGQSLTYTYNGANLVSVTDQDGTFATLAYNDTNNPNSPTSYTDAGGNTWSYTYNQYGQLLSSTPPSGSPEGQTIYTYNETSTSPNYGYLEAIINGIGDTVTFGNYTPLGDAGFITTSPGPGVTNTTTLSYDPQRRLTEVLHPDSRIRSYDFDGHSPKSEVDENSDITTYDFCASCGHLAGISMPAGKTLAWNYGDDSEVIGFTDARSNHTTYLYGTAGELTRETYPDGHYFNYEFDDNGRLQELLDSSSRRHDYSYDSAGRISRIGFQNPSHNAVTFTYHPDGRYHTWDDEAGTTTFSYDSSRRINNIHYNYTRSGLFDNGVARVQDVEYTYFPDRRVHTMTWKDYGTTVNTWTYSYDSAGRISSISDSLGSSVGYAYDGEGKVVTETNSNGTTTEYTYYEPRNWISSIVHKSGGTAFASYLMEFDGGANTIGNITKITELDGSIVTYTYDDLDRLTSETRTGTHPYTRSYTYDLAGNITEIDSTQWASYDAGNKIATISGGSATYDGIGNLTAVSGTGITSAAYAWDTRLNLRSQTSGGTTTEYRYNAVQWRTNKRPPYPAQMIYYVHDKDGRVIGEVPRNGGPIVVYTWGPTGLAHQNRLNGGTGVSFYHQGALAEVRQLSDGAGSVTDTYFYDAYGETISSTGQTVNPHRFGGVVGYYSDGEAVLATWRWYAPSIKRWLKRDPIRYLGGDNVYSYVSGNPILKIDPLGLAELCNHSSDPILYKHEDGGDPLWCLPNTRCRIDGYYRFDGLRPGGNAVGGNKVPDNCNGYADQEGNITWSCRNVSLREIAEYREWPFARYLSDYRFILPTMHPRLRPKPMKPLLSAPYWNPYGGNDPRAD